MGCSGKSKSQRPPQPGIRLAFSFAAGLDRPASVCVRRDRLQVWKENWYSLPEEAAEILNKENPHTSTSSSSAPPPPAPSGERKVVDTTYYDILEVPTDAKTEDIRRQYYRLARKYHPDKNPEDPQAKKRFQQIGEAYQVYLFP